MRALLDVNVLIALLDADHSLHRRATDWFDENASEGWASCPITENGCIRIMSHPNYPHAFPVKAIVERLREATANALHQFWVDDTSLLDAGIVDPARIHGPRQVTDVYLLALATRNGGRFVTFDRGISREAVLGAGKRQLAVL
jgi:toxin-antitoxin system PIN domain toxin